MSKQYNDAIEKQEREIRRLSDLRKYKYDCFAAFSAAEDADYPDGHDNGERETEWSDTEDDYTSYKKARARDAEYDKREAEWNKGKLAYEESRKYAYESFEEYLAANIETMKKEWNRNKQQKKIFERS